jgi:predicted amidohydrolase YtcJ
MPTIKQLRTNLTSLRKAAKVLFVLVALFLLTSAAFAQSGGLYDLTWSSVDGGGGVSTGGTYTLGGIIGQPDAGTMSGGDYTLAGGFWAGAAVRHNVYLPLVVRVYSPSQAELIFYNGTVLTMEGESWDAQAVAVRGDKIMAVGSDAEVIALQGPGTQVIDLDGRTLMPGFVDAHTHIFNDAWYWEMDMEGTQQLALQNGITTLANMYVPPEFVEEMRAFEREGKLIIRTSLYLIYDDACGVVYGDWYMAHPPTRGFGEKLRIGGVKIFSDGGVCGMPALSFDYPEDWGGGQGDLWLSQAELNQAVAQAHNAGYQVAIHAIGDRAVETVQNAIEFALAGQPNTLRHRIEHNVIVRPELRTRYGEIGIVPAIFGWPPTCAELAGESWGAIVGPERLSWLRNYRALLDANPGLHVTWHGDDPWVGPISPILELYGLVTRKEIAEDGVTICEPPDWLAATALTVEEALPLMTIDAAYAIFREDEVGSLKAGKLADLIILSDNPLTVDPDAIKDIELLMTMVGSRVEYCVPGQEALCPGR